VSGTLFVIATPLGNLGDLSPRAAETLRAVALVAAEDTRRTRTLLAHLDAHPRLLSFHAHSTAGRRSRLLAALAAGEAVALVTDAGTPTISDPGALLVAAARDQGATVVVVPGPSAVTAALSGAGLPADRYLFLGFLPRKGPERRARLRQVAASSETVVLFEAANRLIELLDDLAPLCDPARKAVVARELTKRHEEFRAGTLLDLAAYYRADEPRGEVTLVFAGAEQVAPRRVEDDAVRAEARRLLAGGVSRRDAARQLATAFAMSRNEAYRLVASL
jgi:16S rRNA (cytidine1402-2'-O)-methyltransferase